MSEIIKIDNEQQNVWGFASVIEENGQPVIDSQGDVISEDELAKGAYQFVLSSRAAKEMHRGDGVGRLIESVVLTKQLQDSLGIDLGKVAWLVGFHIDDPKVWQRIKRGELPGLSIHGMGKRERM
jgi:hypothetical protein